MHHRRVLNQYSSKCRVKCFSGWVLNAGRRVKCFLLSIDYRSRVVSSLRDCCLLAIIQNPHLYLLVNRISLKFKIDTAPLIDRRPDQLKIQIQNQHRTSASASTGSVLIGVANPRNARWYAYCWVLIAGRALWCTSTCSLIGSVWNSKFGSHLYAVPFDYFKFKFKIRTSLACQPDWTPCRSSSLCDWSSKLNSSIDCRSRVVLVEYWFLIFSWVE